MVIKILSKYLTSTSKLWYYNKAHIIREARNYVNYLNRNGDFFKVKSVNKS